MNYEDINGSSHGKDIFTNGAEGRYAKARSTSTSTTADITPKPKARAPKPPRATATDNSNEDLDQNAYGDGVVKAKKKHSKANQNGDLDIENEKASVTDVTTDGELAVKPKKKRAPKLVIDNDNSDQISTATTTSADERVKTKKSKAPKSFADNISEADSLMANELEQPSTETVTKVKKTKKSKVPKIAKDSISETFDDMPIGTSNEYHNDSEANGIYTGDGFDNTDVVNMGDDISPSYQNPDTQDTMPYNSEYETSIRDAFRNLSYSVDFGQYVGADVWGIINLPKSARNEPRSLREKILPTDRNEKFDLRYASSKPTNKKESLFDRIRSSVNTLVLDEKNMIFGLRPNSKVAYFEEDDVDTDDLHRYAQKLRDLEDQDKEFNPEYLVLRDGKTVYAVHETDADGNTTISKRKPIYDRFRDQAPDDNESTDKNKLLSILRRPFSRSKEKDIKAINSPK